MELAVQQNVSLYWHEGQVDLADDIRQFHTEGGLATANVSHKVNKEMLSSIISMFTQMDVVAGELYGELIPHTKNNEAKVWFSSAQNKEGIHQRSYALIVEELGFPQSKWGEFKEYAEMHNKIELMSDIKGRDHSKPLDFAKTLTQLLLSEGICLFGAFAFMLNLGRFGKVSGTNTVNEWSLRDEEQHIVGNIIVRSAIIKEDLSDVERIELDSFTRKMVKELVEAEHTFIDLLFKMGDQEELTKGDMKGYITYLGNLRLNQLGLIPSVSQNPLEWMPYILSGQKQSNFFEKKETGYDHKGLEGQIDYSEYKYLINIKK